MQTFAFENCFFGVTLNQHKILVFLYLMCDLFKKMNFHHSAGTFFPFLKINRIKNVRSIAIFTSVVKITTLLESNWLSFYSAAIVLETA